MEPLRIVELLLIVGIIPLVMSMFNNLKNRVSNLEEKKVDKEVFQRLEITLSEHRKETRDGFASIETTLREMISHIGGFNGRR